MGKGTQERRGWNGTWYLGMQGWEREHRSPVAKTGSGPDLRTADPSPWDEDPRLFPHPQRSRDAPNTSGGGAEPGTGARRGILPFSKPSSLQEQLFHGKHSLDPAPGTAQRARSSSRAAPAFPGLSQPGCAGEVARKGLKNVPKCHHQALLRDPSCSFGDKDTATRRAGNTYIHSGYLLLFPKGKRRGKKTGG